MPISFKINPHIEAMGSSMQVLHSSGGNFYGTSQCGGDVLGGIAIGIGSLNNTNLYIMGTKWKWVETSCKSLGIYVGKRY